MQGNLDLKISTFENRGFNGILREGGQKHRSRKLNTPSRELGQHIRKLEGNRGGENRSVPRTQDVFWKKGQNL